MTMDLRPELPRVPSLMRDLPIHRGYPVPWFVAWIDGVPDFRVADGEKKHLAITEGCCWLCGKRISRGDRLAFVIGPMCAVNRISSEPPQHEECARFAATACPFLVRPHMDRREGGMPEDRVHAPGLPILRNPGVALVWITRACTPFHAHGENPGILFRFGKPVKVEAYREGRAATLQEIAESVDSGLPILEADAKKDGPRATLLFYRQVDEARRLLRIG